MKLHTILKNIEIKNDIKNRNINIRNLAIDTKKVRQDCLFICLKLIIKFMEDN